MSNETTTVVGYYNGNKWPINLVISSLNVTLNLPPGEYVRDTQGRKINDPFFEAYARNRQLSRETSDTPLRVLRVPVPSSTPRPHDGQSVRQVTEFTHSAAGVRMPVIPQPRILPQAQTINKNSVTPMTMDEARKRGLAHRTREVPEDYGITDTDSALPPRLPPPMKIATDMMPTKPTQLPQELLEAAKEDMPAANAMIVQQLSQKVTGPAPEEDAPTGFMNVVRQPAPTPIPAPVKAVSKPQPVRTKAPPPPPVEESMPVPTLEVEEPPVEEDETNVPEPEPEPEPESEVVEEPRPVTARNKYSCLACGLGFPFHSQLERHALAKHKADVEAILAPYPKPR